MEKIDPISVSFPLKGEWCPVNTPGYKVPSHGTNQLGQRYAYDFLQIDWRKEKGYKFYKTSTFQSLVFGVALSDTYCWSQPIYAPFSGEVIETKDGLVERNPVHMVRDLAIVIKNGLLFQANSNEDLQCVLGNYIILKSDEGFFSLIAHAKTASIKISKGDRVSEGQELAQVGHSGNSTAPHLHFQLMDGPNLLEAKGLPCSFKSYQIYEDEKWVKVLNGIPARRQRINA